MIVTNTIAVVGCLTVIVKDDTANNLQQRKQMVIIQINL